MLPFLLQVLAFCRRRLNRFFPERHRKAECKRIPPGIFCGRLRRVPPVSKDSFIGSGSSSEDYLVARKSLSLKLDPESFLSFWVYSSATPQNLQINAYVDGVPLVSSLQLKFDELKVVLADGAAIATASLMGDVVWISVFGNEYAVNLISAGSVADFLEKSFGFEPMKFMDYGEGASLFVNRFLGFEVGKASFTYLDGAVVVSLPFEPSGRAYIVSRQRLYPGGTSSYQSEVLGFWVYNLWSSRGEFYMEPSESRSRDLVILSPNGDGKNDVVYIQMDPRQVAEVYDLNGRLVKSFRGFWDGRINGNPAPGGLYFLVLKEDGVPVSKRLLLILR